MQLRRFWLNGKKKKEKNRKAVEAGAFVVVRFLIACFCRWTYCASAALIFFFFWYVCLLLNICAYVCFC